MRPSEIPVLLSPRRISGCQPSLGSALGPSSRRHRHDTRTFVTTTTVTSAAANESSAGMRLRVRLLGKRVSRFQWRRCKPTEKVLMNLTNAARRIYVERPAGVTQVHLVRQALGQGGTVAVSAVTRLVGLPLPSSRPCRRSLLVGMAAERSRAGSAAT